MHLTALFLLLLLSSAVWCNAAVYGDALYRNVLSAVPGISFVSSTPSMMDDTSVYFTSFGWPSSRVAQQADYVSVPVAAMALCLAVHPAGAINLTVAPSVSEIGGVLTGQSTGSGWVRSDWASSSSQRVSRVYWAASSTLPLLNSLKTSRAALFTSASTLPSAVVNNAGVSILATDTDVATALAADPNAVAFLPLIAAAQANMACLSITTPTLSGGTEIMPPQLQKASASLITVTSSPPSATCPLAAGCYPLLGALVAHVRKRSSMSTACNTSTSLLSVIFSFTSSTSPIAAPLGRWRMLFPSTTTQVATLLLLTSATCMPETMVLSGAGGVSRLSALNDWFYEYYMLSNGTVFFTYNGTSLDYANSALDSRTTDFASGSALLASDRLAYPSLHSLPSLITVVAVIVNIGQPVSVTLPRCSITSIFNGTIQWWNDTAIQAVNPMLVMPQRPIDVTVRMESSTTTDIFMEGLRALDRECFGTTSIDPSALIPSISRASRFTGNVAVGTYVATTPYSITWVPYDYAHNNGLNQITIEAKDGSATSPADVEDSLITGYFNPTTSDFTLSEINMGYPFIGVGYMIVKLVAQGACDRNKAAADFVIWTLSSSTAAALASADLFLPVASDVRTAGVQFLTGAATCNGAPLYPVPPPPLVWWPIALALGVTAILTVAVGSRAWQYYWVHSVRPSDPAAPVAVMFIGVKNQAAVQEAGEKNVAAVCRRVAETTRRLVRKHRCYEARRVDPWTTMIVAKSAQAAIACAEDIVLSLSVDVQWVDDVMTHPLPGQPQAPQGPLQTSRMSSKSGARSGRSGASGRLPTRKRSRIGSNGALQPSHASQTSSSNSRLTLQQCVPQIYAGVHWANVMIDDSQDDIVSYYGSGIAAAASVADLAVDGQVVVSGEVVDELNSTTHTKSSRRNDYVFTTLSSASEMTVLSMTTPRFPEWLMARTAERRKSLEEKGSDSGAGNTIAAAMASADGALAKRRIAVVSLLLRELVTEGAEGRASVIRDTLDDLRSIVTAHRGEIHSITDGVVTVTIGAGGPVAMAPVRAAQIAMEASELCLAAGVHSGPALVGNAMGGKSATVGRVVAGATLMRLVAARANIPVVASDAMHADLTSRFQLATVDLVALPWDMKKHVRCFGVVEARADGNEGEWMYEMQDGFAPLEGRFNDVLHTGKTAPTASSDDLSKQKSTRGGFLEDHEDFCALSDELYSGLHTARASNTMAEFAVQRLVAIGSFAVVGGTRAAL